MRRDFLLFFIFKILYASGIEFLNIYPDARGSAMNFLFSSSEGVEGIYWNPANIAKINNPEIIMSHREWFSDVRYDYFGVSFYKEKVGKLGLSMTFFRNDTISPIKKSLFYTNTIISYSKRYKDLFWGINLKGIYGRRLKSSDFSFSFDFGLSYPYKFFNFALVLKNLGAPLKYGNIEEKYPLQLGGGVSFWGFSRKLKFELGSSYNFPKKLIKMGFGGEYLLWDFLTLRMGYSKIISDTLGKKGVDTLGERGVTFGAGIKFLGFNFDYSFIPGGILKEVHVFTLKYNFEIIERVASEMFKTLSKVKYIFEIIERQKTEEEILKIKTREELKKKERMVAENYVISGKEKMEKGELEEARKDFDIALIWDPDNEEAKKYYILVESRIITRKISESFLNARKYIKKGEYTEALFYINEILKIDPENPDARVLGDSVELLIKEKSKFIREENANYFNLGIEFFKKGDYVKARDYFLKILEIEPENREAKKYYNECIGKIEKVYSFYFKKAENLYKDKKYVEAKNILEKAMTYKNTEEVNKMLKEIDKKLKEISEQNYQNGILFFSKGKIEDAYFYFIKARIFEPENTEINSYIEKIEKNYKDKIDDDLIYLKGIEAYVENDFRTAINFWLKVKEINPFYPNIDKNIQRAKSKIEELEKG